MSGIALVTALGLDDIVACRPDGTRRVRDLLADAAALVPLLPAGDHLINLCADRYHFAVGFMAGLLAGKVSLQPSSQSPGTFRQLATDYAGLACLRDASSDTAGDSADIGLPTLRFPAHLASRPEAVTAIPTVPAGQLAAILFTSGSTGRPQPHRKTWGKLVANGQAGAESLALGRGRARGRPVLVGTVPVQHSYGFESTFLLALHGGCAFWSGKPFFPQDIVAALASVPAPRLLVTTPFHLSTLLSAALPVPELATVLSATAPLAPALARQVESTIGAHVLEIYGSTETGQIAWRESSQGETWQLLPGVDLIPAPGQVLACGTHVEGEVPLADQVELQADRRFLLRGRQADLVNIAGKRTSLAYLNHQLVSIPGVRDGAFFLPDDVDANRISRLVAFAVAPGLGQRGLLAALRERIDPLFMPRPLVLLERLPRNDTGKLPRSVLQQLHQERLGGGRV